MKPNTYIFSKSYKLLIGGIETLKQRDHPNPISGVLGIHGGLANILTWDNTKTLPKRDYDEGIRLLGEHAEKDTIQSENIKRMIASLERRAKIYFPTKPDLAAA
jgi:hypothetical protein|tara:strand:+ start:945 stop:1256 length:312 start_codon:yes stop_codon:yes gene_type:complete